MLCRKHCNSWPHASCHGQKNFVKSVFNLSSVLSLELWLVAGGVLVQVLIFLDHLMHITILGRHVLQAAWGVWRTPAPAAQADDHVDEVTHAARSPCRSPTSDGRHGQAARWLAGFKRAIFVERTTAGRLSSKREQRFGKHRVFYNASRRAVSDRLENMPYNGIGFTGDISGTTSTPK